VGAEILGGWCGLEPGEGATMKDPLLLSLSLAVLPGLAPLLVSLFPMASILYSLDFMRQIVKICAHPDI
jgi:hypothetical protein